MVFRSKHACRFAAAAPARVRGKQPWNCFAAAPRSCTGSPSCQSPHAHAPRSPPRPAHAIQTARPDRWDYGYQITQMANRTIIVDNNTWNNTHIATVGRAMSSNEDDAYEIMRKLDVDYVLVIFGGVSGYSSDDINKFLWMVGSSGDALSDRKLV